MIKQNRSDLFDNVTHGMLLASFLSALIFGSGCAHSYHKWKPTPYRGAFDANADGSYDCTIRETQCRNYFALRDKMVVEHPTLNPESINATIPLDCVNGSKVVRRDKLKDCHPQKLLNVAEDNNQKSEMEEYIEYMEEQQAQREEMLAAHPELAPK